VLRGALSISSYGAIAHPGKAAHWSYRIDLRSLENLLVLPECSVVEVYVAFCGEPHVPLPYLRPEDAPPDILVVRSKPIRLRYHYNGDPAREGVDVEGDAE